MFKAICFDSVCEILPVAWDVSARLLLTYQTHMINVPQAVNVLRFQAMVASLPMSWPEHLLKLRYETLFLLMSKVCQFPLVGILGPGQPSTFASPQMVNISTSAFAHLSAPLVEHTMQQFSAQTAKPASINITQWDEAAGSVVQAWQIIFLYDCELCSQ